MDSLLLKNNFESIRLQMATHLKKEYDCVLIIGQKKGSKGITLERVTLNLGAKDELLIKNGDVAYFSTLPLERIYKTFKSAKLSVRYSNNAGKKYCNCAFYNTMYLLGEANFKVEAGLIHIPAKNKTNTIEDLCNMVRIIIMELVKYY